MPDEIQGTPVQIADEELDLVKRLADARRAMADWKKIEDDLRKQLLDRLEVAQTNTALTASGAPCYRTRTSVRRSVDAKKLEAMYPEVYADCFKESEVTTLVIDDSFKPEG